MPLRDSDTNPFVTSGGSSGGGRLQRARRAEEDLKKDLFKIYDEIGQEEFEKIARDCGLDLAAAWGAGRLAPIDRRARAAALIGALFTQNCRNAFIQSCKKTYNTLATEVNRSHAEKRESIERRERFERMDRSNAELEKFERYRNTA